MCYDISYMKFFIHIPLTTTPEQHLQLCELRRTFAQVCNCLAPAVQRSRIWNRIALHHMHYHALREQFPELGSQMVCNAIYAVSKMARLIYQHPKSPYSVATRHTAELPLMRFADSCPVYFDRHTLSVKADQLSLFTLNGRMHFKLTLASEQRELFSRAKVREIVLKQNLASQFVLSIQLESDDASITHSQRSRLSSAPKSLPDLVPNYLSIEVAS